MVSRLKYVIVQAGKQIFRNRAMALASVFAITAMLLILGLFFVILLNLNMMAENVKQDYNNVEIFIKDNVSEEQILEMKDDVSQWSNVKSVNYRSKEEALEVLKNRWGKSGYLLDSLEKNPLPNSLIITMTDLNKADEISSQATKLNGVEDIKYYKDTVDKLIKATNFIQIAGLIVMAFLIVVSVVVVSNTIKLTVFNRSEEISIMKYVGATNWFIRGPFLAEGIIIGAFSALFSALIVTVIYDKVATAVGQDVMTVLSMPLVPVGFLATNLVWIFVSLGVSIGAWGSIISMRRFLDT